MKKLIVVIMALITIFSASVTSFGYPILEGIVNGSNLDLITNLSFGSRNCTLIYYNSTSPDVTDTDFLGNPLFQKTSYSALSSLYDKITINGVSLAQDFVRDRTYHWHVAGGHCFILINGDRNGAFIQNQLWAGNFDGKILYCDALTSETAYDVVAIAGFNYYLTDRPPATYTTGYLGDLQVTRAQLDDIYSLLKNGTSNSDVFYYYSASSYNGEWRYYLRCNVGDDTYQVCNSSGQLFYAVKDDGSSEDTGGGGSTFDPTEVITAINSVYDAINSQGSRLANGLSQLTITVNSISDSFSMHISNTLEGFSSINSQLSTLNSYFTDLSGLFPVQETITLLGSDTRVAWDSADRITNVTAAGFNGDLIVKERPGDLVDESGYEKVTLSPDTTEYTLSTVDGYRRITADNEYPDTGEINVPSGTVLYFPFEDSISSAVNNYSLNYGGTPSYALGVSGNAFVYDGSHYLYSDTLLTDTFGSSKSATISYWLYISNYSSTIYYFEFGNSTGKITCNVSADGYITYYVRFSGVTHTYTGQYIPLNTWVHVAIAFDGSNCYSFFNGNLDNVVSYPYFQGLYTGLSLGGTSGNQTLPLGSMIDDFILVKGVALWTSSFDPYKSAIFDQVAKDYFLPCANQTIGLVFDDTINKTLSPTDVNGNAITMGRLEDDFSEIYMDISTMMWYCHDPQTQTEILLSSANQQIMNDTIYVRQNYTMLPADQITADALQNLLPVDSPVYLDMPEGAKLTITYDHYTGWFRMMYILMDKQTKLLSDLDIVNETIINVENTVIDITNSNPAYNVFYITKTDGTTESVGDAAKDAAVFVGDILSMFYRLVFDDALDNAGVIQDFEDVLTTTNTGVNVW